MIPLRTLVIAIGLLAGVAAAAVTAWAAYEGERIIAVDVSGARTVAKETILSKAQSKAGSPYQDAIVSEDIRRLFTLGYFTDVRADVERLPEGLKLIFVVQEKPVVASVQVDGNRVLRKARIQELFAVSTGELHDPRKVK